GGVYVSVAKRLVAADVETDVYAGPTELIVFADEYCNPRFPAWDMIAQAEHGADTLCGLVTYSAGYANEVRAEILKLLPTLERREHIEASLERGFSAVCSSESTACGFIDAVAPEHLELLARDSRSYANHELDGGTAFAAAKMGGLPAFSRKPGECRKQA